MICYQKKRKCGNKDLEHCGCMKEIKIPDFSIVELLTGIAEIELRNWKTIWVKGAWMRMA